MPLYAPTAYALLLLPAPASFIMAICLLIMPILLSFLLGFNGNHVGRTGAAFLSLLLHALSAFLCLLLCLEVTIAQLPSLLPIAPLLVCPSYCLHYALMSDVLSTTMVLIIEAVLTAVLLYTIAYLRTEAFTVRFYSLMNAFAFSMNLLALSHGPVLMFIGWEAVGFCSYLLIAFYHSRHSAAQSALKAVLVNRIGDYSLFLALIAILLLYGTSS